jgi:hypothetical protein
MGLSGAGKDTVALMMERQLKVLGAKHVLIGGFADPLRKISKEIGLDPFDRTRKELDHVVGLNEFEDRMYAAFEIHLGRYCPNRDLAALWAYFMDEMEASFLKDRWSTGGGYYQISPRTLMQTLGTAGRKVRDTFWIDLAEEKWSKAQGYVLVTDCRYPNEVEAADSIVLIRRPGVAPVADHESEHFAAALTAGTISIPNMNFIDNDGTLDDLIWNVRALLSSYAVFFAH